MQTKYADRITNGVKAELWKKHFNENTEGVCKICNISINNKTFSWKYIFPKKRGGRNNILNLLPVCSNCDKDYNSIKDEINLISYLKNKQKINVELDNEYKEYQDRLIYHYNKAYNTELVDKYIKPNRTGLAIPIIEYLISVGYYDHKWTLEDFREFINEDPDIKCSDDRRILFKDIIINEIEYSEIKLRYSILGTGMDSTREISMSFKRKSTEFIAGCFSSYFVYFTKNEDAKDYCKEVQSIIQLCQYLIFYGD